MGLLHETGKKAVRMMRLGLVTSGLVTVSVFVTGSFATGAPSAVPAAKELTLVANGVSRAPIVIFQDAPPFTRRAADELASYIEKVSGARPDVIEGEPDPIPEHAIWVGVQPALKGLFPNLDFDFKHPEEILISANEDHLVIAGRDRWDPDHLRVTYPSGDGTLEVNGVQQEYGTVNAVYTFLQDNLGVRWFWPGADGEDIIRRATIAFAPFEFRYHPRFRGRAGIFVYSQLELQHGHSQDWLRLQRLQLDSFRLDTSHAFRWWDRFGETHPEFFALQPDGTRGGNPPFPSARNVKMCQSNPAVWEQWLREVDAELERNPTKQVFSAAENDGGAQGFCVCDNCRAWDPPNGPTVRYSWRGVSEERVGLADRQITFANTLGRMLKERYPDRDYYVTIMAYGNSRPAPVAAVPDDNVIVSLVFNFHNRYMLSRGDPAADHRRMFLDWAGKGFQNLAWRPNLGGSAGWQLGMPNVAPHRAIEDLRLAADNHVMALLFDAVWEHWATQGPHYYMLAQMAWNPYADGEAILDDYYQRAFGPAVSPMKDYWDILEAATDEILFKEKPEKEVWDGDFYRRAYAHLDRAAAAVTDAPARYGQRVAFVRAGLDYMRLYYDTEALIARLRASGGKDAEAEAAARANWKQLARIFQDHPDAFDPVRIAVPTGPTGLGRMRRIHPDYYDRSTEK